MTLSFDRNSTFIVFRTNKCRKSPTQVEDAARKTRNV
jgi:hypothetical protein